MDSVNNENAAQPGSDAGTQTQPGSTPGADAAGLMARIETLREQVVKANAAMERIECSRRIEQLLRGAKATDISVAAELVEHTIAESGGKMEIQAAIEQVSRKRPALFKPAAPAASAMSGRPDLGPDDSLTRLAVRISSGDHRAIMEYMRARRNR